MGYETSVRGFHDHDHDHDFRNHDHRFRNHDDRFRDHDDRFRDHDHDVRDHDHGVHGNTINAGSGKALTKLGAGKDDVTPHGDATVLGGSGATTIFGSNGTLDFVGGSRPASRGGSSGSNTFEAGSGNETLTGASATSKLPDPKDTFTFLKGHAGGTDLISNFISGNVIKLEGYGPEELARALDHAKYTPQGATITLSDTKITFAGVTHLDPKSFTS